MASSQFLTGARDLVTQLSPSAPAPNQFKPLEKPIFYIEGHTNFVVDPTTITFSPPKWTGQVYREGKRYPSSKCGFTSVKLMRYQSPVSLQCGIAQLIKTSSTQAGIGLKYLESIGYSIVLPDGLNQAIGPNDHATKRAIMITYRPKTITFTLVPELSPNVDGFLSRGSLSEFAVSMPLTIGLIQYVGCESTSAIDALFDNVKKGPNQDENDEASEAEDDDGDEHNKDNQDASTEAPAFPKLAWTGSNEWTRPGGNPHHGPAGTTAPTSKLESGTSESDAAQTSPELKLARAAKAAKEETLDPSSIWQSSDPKSSSEGPEPEGDDFVDAESGPESGDQPAPVGRSLTGPPLGLRTQSDFNLQTGADDEEDPFTPKPLKRVHTDASTQTDTLTSNPKPAVASSFQLGDEEED